MSPDLDFDVAPILRLHCCNCDPGGHKRDDDSSADNNEAGAIMNVGIYNILQPYNNPSTTS